MLGVVTAGAALAEDQPSGADFVAVFTKIYGVHDGYRVNHAKGILAEGTFTPTADAAKLSKAAHFKGPAVPVTVRFSPAGGAPNIPDSDPNGYPKGMAIKFKPAGGEETDIVAFSVNGFFASTPKEFLEFLTAVSQSPPGTASPTPVEKFVSTHPTTKHFLDIPKPMPASYAAEAYYGVNAFKFTNAKGESKYIRYFIRPAAGESHLDAAAAAKTPPNFLEDELAARLKKGPAVFHLFAQVAAAGDPTNDGSKLWPDSRPMVDLGTISLAKLVADNDKVQRGLLFTPTNLIDGISESDDPIIDARGNAYAESYARRAQ
jgi:catalase